MDINLTRDIYIMEENLSITELVYLNETILLLIDHFFENNHEI